MACALSFVLIGTFIRRWLGGAVMAVNAAFFPTIGILFFGLIYQGIAFLGLRRRKKLGGVIPLWERTSSVAVDLAVPIAVLFNLQLHSPRGAYAALSGPTLLMIPLVILLSILRLRPWFSFWTGVCAALLHLGLVLRAIHVDGLGRELYPVLFGYDVLIATIGMAAAAVSLMARRYVIEAVEEATAAERALHAIAVIELDLRVARDIQKGLLPLASPELAGFDVAGMARPAELAGGDYYDWQPLPDGRLAVVIADVTGHGVGPAIVMAVCRAYARAAAPVTIGPDKLMQRLNDLIYDDVKGARFITMVLAVIGIDGNVEMVSAGHGPTLLYRAATREVESLGSDGLPLGVAADQEYGPHQLLHLEPKDVLLMLTDGFFEHFRVGDTEQFGVERLNAALRDNADKSSADIITAIDKAVADFARGAPQIDDMTAVVIKRQ